MGEWEQMTQELVIDGRPGDVESAALGWEQLLKHLVECANGLRTNVKDLNAAWKGPAYDAFMAHIEGVAKGIDRIHEDATKGQGIVQSLRTAASNLAAAQADFPVPAAMSDEVLAARNATVTFHLGPFEPSVRADMLAKFPGVSIGQSIVDFFNDNTADARKVYDRVGNQYQGQLADTPGETGGEGGKTPNPTKPDLSNGPGTVKPGGVPKLGGAGSPGGGPKFDPSSIKAGDLPGAGGTGIPGSTMPDTDFGSGLAGAGPMPSVGGAGSGGLGGLGSGGGGIGSGGLGSGGLGAGGLGMAGLGGAGLRGAGAGRGLAGGKLGAGKFAGGGALGKPVSPAAGGMMGGAGAGAGRGQGGRGGGAGAKAGTGAGARGGMMGGAGHGAGYGADEDNRDTWLQEDEDVWGGGGDTPPGVLR